MRMGTATHPPRPELIVFYSNTPLEVGDCSCICSNSGLGIVDLHRVGALWTLTDRAAKEKRVAYLVLKLLVLRLEPCDLGHELRLPVLDDRKQVKTNLTARIALNTLLNSRSSDS